MYKLSPRKAFLSALCLGLLTVCGQANALSVRGYRSCVSMIAQNPARAFEAAQEWRDYGGGPASRHCLALSLVALGMYERAAAVLEDVATAQPPLAADGEPGWTLDAAQRADFLVQAGNAWLVAGKASKAYSTFNLALAEPTMSDLARGELLIDRARALAETKDYSAAIADLDRATEFLGVRADILTYRASAWRAAGRLWEAKVDIEQALQLEPENTAALFERGILRYEADDFGGARADWGRVRALAPGTPTADAAAANLAALDAPQGVSEEDAPIRLELRGLPPGPYDPPEAPASGQVQDGKVPTRP